MAHYTPTTKEISDNIVNQIGSAISQTIPFLPLSFSRVLAKAFSGIFVLIYKYAGWIFLQIFVRTASFKEVEILGKKITPLVEWGRLIGIGDPASPIQAELTINIIVENQVGSLLAGTQLFSAINGITYLLITSVLLDAEIVQGTIRAQSDADGNSGAGIIGNLQIGDIVSFVNPQSNVARDTTVDSISKTGADGEQEQNYRQRVIDRFQKIPQGGSGVDYELWGETVLGVVSIYPYTGDEGFVDIYVEVIETIETPDGIPTPEQLDEVAYAITFDDDGKQTRKPVNAKLNMNPITRVAFNVQVYGLEVEDPVTIQADITNAVTNYFLGREPFIEGVTVLPSKYIVSREDLSSIVNSFVSAANGTFSSLTLQNAAVPAVDIPSYYLQEGEKSKLNEINFIGP